MSKKVLVICGTGVATSTVVMSKLKSFIEEKGLEAKLHQSKVSDVLNTASEYDLVVTTTIVSKDLHDIVLNAVPLLTGVGKEQFFADFEAALK
ncbi:PTS sugar transporter subunit IIB [Radiobacillus kanasensis]|uniref:PTS sugar transporter subunit IIB n=1 Tax=Radiobacillus kanasensis TaxID=2844358 RepID=UPI001E4218F3|nr:PTS sugar transporter subunit IIB [Radiobacillus kanasensis]UFT98598.1 PTS sugar transporter subunit IIB [Radiobacillus kanasensis]